MSGFFHLWLPSAPVLSSGDLNIQDASTGEKGQVSAFISNDNNDQAPLRVSVTARLVAAVAYTRIYK
jgi:hypothetical protein